MIRALRPIARVLPAALAVAVLVCAAAAPARAGVGEKLQRMLETEDYQERNALYQELNQEVGPRDVRILYETLMKIESATRPYYYVVYLLDRAGGQDAVPYLQKALEHPLIQVRQAVAQRLAYKGHTEWADGFLATIGDPDAPLNDRLLLTSAFSGLQTPPPDTERYRDNLALVRRLVELVRTMREAEPADPHADTVGERIIRNLTYRKIQAFRDLYREALENGGPKVRAAAAAALVQLGDASALGALKDDWEKGAITDQQMLSHLSYLRGPRSEPVLELLRSVLEKTDYKPLLLRVIELLGEARDRRSTGRLKELLDHEDGDIAAAAATALGRLESSGLRDFWKQRLNHEDPVQRVRAAAALVALDEAELGRPVLLESLDDDDAQVRTEAAKALARAPSGDVVEAMLDHLDDPDQGVRTAAWGTLRKVMRALFPYRGPNLGRVGYDPNADPATQADAIRVLKEDWQRRR